MTGRLACSLVLLLPLTARAQGPLADSARAVVRAPLPAEAPPQQGPAPSLDEAHPDDALHIADPELVTQLGRTVVALVLVIALIYVCAKLAPKLLPNLVRGRGSQVSVVERVQLDAKHTMFVVQVAHGPKLLVGTGEGGVRLLCAMPEASGEQPPSFMSTMGAISAVGSSRSDSAQTAHRVGGQDAKI